MIHQILVSCRMPSPGVAAGGARSYLDRARALTRRAEALGAELVAWSATTMAFAWDTESVEEAITLAVSLREDAAPTEQTWACGIAEGAMERLAPAGRATLAWGEPLVRAVALARIADGGEVLLDEELARLHTGELRATTTRIGRDAGREVRGRRLDLEDPWNRLSHSEPAPDSARHLETDVEGTDPEVFAHRMVEATRQALLSGNARSLQRLSEGLRATGEHDALADRMRAMARLSGGQIGEALRALRRSRRQAEDEPPVVRCQASLALAFALSSAGRPDEALLEGLDALARAREAGDRRAQAACLAFLAKLFTRVGHEEGAARLQFALGNFAKTPSLMDLAEVRRG